MTDKCSFCGKWFDTRYVIKDVNNNTYCEECSKERLISQFKGSLEDVKAGRITKI